MTTMPADVQPAIDQAVATLAGIPAKEWCRWVVYLLESLDVQATHKSQPEAYRDMLYEVLEYTENRLTGEQA
ncbi:MAG: hypothetical protein L0332_22490 [Chloroflexi bacterium]|nr:hypothetical protein [Chloroflexota bacterium]MCI0649662.1 hypothetical protein [Chloroflexota bacterium]MCI0729463.1 hypothetical protein [Chloroflexota bacterium]